jgi:cytochrome b561
MNRDPLSSHPTPERYDKRTIVLHWTTAVLVVVLWRRMWPSMPQWRTG